jgi:hypothetical protein
MDAYFESHPPALLPASRPTLPAVPRRRNLFRPPFASGATVEAPADTRRRARTDVCGPLRAIVACSRLLRIV